MSAKTPGRLAQLVERLPYKQAVTGSSPVPSIFPRLYTVLPVPLPSKFRYYSNLLNIIGQKMVRDATGTSLL